MGTWLIVCLVAGLAALSLVVIAFLANWMWTMITGFVLEVMATLGIWGEFVFTHNEQALPFAWTSTAVVLLQLALALYMAKANMVTGAMDVGAEGPMT